MALASMIIEPPLVKEIRSYAGLLANIPSGWELCDGANGKPDLRNAFIKGVASAENPGGTGGSATHQHNNLGAHQHDAHGFTQPSAHNIGSIGASPDAAVKVGTSASNAAASGHLHPAPTITGHLGGAVTPVSHSSQGGHQHDAVSNEPVWYKLALITKPEWWP